MKVLQINSVCGRGSTGRIATDLADVLAEHGHTCRIAYGRGTVPEKYQDIAVRIGTDWDVRVHGLQTRLFDAHGFSSKRATHKFLEWVREYDPDVIHLHNIHGYYINIELLFEYLKAAGKPVVWTLHDCWAFTGHCSHFVTANCEQWKTHCKTCTQMFKYPKCSGRGNVENNYTRKKAAFTNVPNLTIVTPSQWLAGVVKESFLQDYPIYVIPNGIDLDVFKPTESDFREKYGLVDKKIVLGVANVWGKSKGLSDFIKLSKMLDDRYQIVLVGLTEKQIAALPKNILGITRTNSTKELAEIYTAADVLVNPSVEETMGLVTVEAMACGTSVITYDLTAVPEVVGNSGYVVRAGDVRRISELLDLDIKSTWSCIGRAKLFDKKTRYMQYLSLYNGEK